MKKRVIIADDHNIFRQGLKALLEAEDGYEVVAEADNGRDLVKLVRQDHPDLVIVDVAMPDMNGIEATRQIKLLDDGIKVLALSMHSDSRFVTQMLKAGANGYMLKDCAFNELREAIRTLLRNRPYLSPGITDLVVKAFLSQSADTPRSGGTGVLSAREREVLQLLAEGHSTNRIAEILNISSKTVDTHRRQIMAKLDIHSVAELTKYAIREGLTILD